ncbi:hypothetical protein SAMN04487944_11255 [Gracilibacillus ureilyticus]|uniref:Permuted papain-like amidase enzyme, YaeF/YiiX, C92 family n=1 Tax=Gracilibacillus ureilyticus TaxID=531814 RepID=A0A1H9SXA9_9BACI|nr:hypothetical protein [Gracilibacillus ureilyticus]SER89642.1 hypothetical protein SAMN04487944_11255 [Gracilibacillus ureilyticus]
MKIRKVYLLFTDTGTVFSRMINLFTKSKLNHASISFNEELTEVYSFGRRQPYNPLSGGFVKEDVRAPFFSKATCAIYQLSITEDTYHLLMERVKKMETETDQYRYNLLGLVGVLLNLEWQRERAFFCSEFVATMLREAGVYTDAKPACLTKPQDLKEWQQLTLIYHGDLAHYLQKQGVCEVTVTPWKRLYS